jgi:hypothetical protein
VRAGAARIVMRRIVLEINITIFTTRVAVDEAGATGRCCLARVVANVIVPEDIARTSPTRFSDIFCMTTLH